jgi:DNA-directed RNA polymerase subunit N (RpoN/RPB10)
MSLSCGCKVSRVYFDFVTEIHRGVPSPSDVPDQSAIVRQYMRYTAQINSGKNAAQVVRRALQV